MTRHVYDIRDSEYLTEACLIARAAGHTTCMVKALPTNLHFISGTYDQKSILSFTMRAECDTAPRKGCVARVPYLPMLDKLLNLNDYNSVISIDESHGAVSINGDRLPFGVDMVSLQILEDCMDRRLNLSDDTWVSGRLDDLEMRREVNIMRLFSSGAVIAFRHDDIFMSSAYDAFHATTIPFKPMTVNDIPLDKMTTPRVFDLNILQPVLNMWSRYTQEWTMHEDDLGLVISGEGDNSSIAYVQTPESFGEKLLN